MRPVLTLIGGPILAAAVLAIALAFPNPTDLAQVIAPPERNVVAVNAGGPNVETIVTNLSSELPQPVAQVTRGNGDCFQDLALADKTKLDRCAEVVYQALIEVEKANQAGYVRDAIEDPNRGRAVERLRFAAVEVCRSQWATEGTSLALKSTPACRAAEIKVASDID